MTKKNIFLIVAALVLAAFYVIYFTDWFKPKTIQIFHTSRNLLPRMLRGGALTTLVFGINQKLKLTELRVVPAAEYETNLDAVPLWHLISDSNSVPVNQFHYGQFIPGMKPAIKGAHPQPLETNLTYHLILQAGQVRGDHNFEVK